MASNAFKQRLAQWLAGMEPKKRAQVVKGGIVSIVLVVCLILYYGSGRSKVDKIEPTQAVSTISVGESRLEDDIRASVEKQGEENRNQNKAQTDEIARLKEAAESSESKMKAMEKVLEAFANTSGPVKELDLPESRLAGAKPLPPLDGSQDPANWQRPGKGGEPLIQSIEFIGEIGTVEPAVLKTQAVQSAQDNAKKKNPRYFLPVSFMPAKLLTGVSAKTVESAKGDPEPVVMRIQAPAILPNEVRAALDGCFVVAHGYGSLASERFEARLVSMNCLDFEGRSVIEAPVNGIVVDKDGSKGMTGRPVAKMGANMMRLFLAGLLDGGAQAFAQTASITSVSPLGQTQSIDPDMIGRAAAGKGVSQASGELTKIYSELVRQSAPVLEVGPQKDVTVVLTEGAWLEVKALEEGVL